MKQCFKHLVICLLSILIFISKLLALDGAYGSHDPSTLVKEKDKYWMFTTGNGIYAAYSTDLFKWNTGPKTVFPIGTWPSWINQAVPGFGGIFWAPDCVYMNGKYYIYYSCSTFGSPVSAIGVATSPTLDQDAPDYKWTDLGMVVSSATKSDVNAIDPAILKDDNGKIYMTYGSFSGGIGVVELDPETGKRKAGAAIVRVAGGNGADWEAPYLFKEGSNYYLMVNRGACCKGTSSTYRIVMGRSTNVFGPYADMSGVDLKSGGGTQVIGTSGKYIGPGHFGLLRENGVNIVSMHYYDGSDNGNAKLDIANMGFNNGWPFITRDWVAAGRYKITNQNSKLVWDSWGCTGNSGEPVAQGNWSNLTCQQWNFTPVGNGIYEIASAQSGMVVGLAPDPYIDAGVEGGVSSGLSPDTTAELCNPNNGAKLQLQTRLGTDCQRFKIERTADGTFVLTSMVSPRVVEVPAASLSVGTQLVVWDHNGGPWQRWYINTPGTSLITKVTNPGPKHGAPTVDPRSVRLSWQGVSSRYNIYFGTSPDNLQPRAERILDTSFVINDLIHQQQYFWRVDAVRNGEVARGNVWSFTASDTTAPIVITKSITVTLKGGTASIQPKDVDSASYDHYGIQYFQLDKSVFTCSDIGANEVVLTVTDNNGNSASGLAMVHVSGVLPKPSIAVSRTDPTYTGGDANTIYIGYGAQNVTLTATNEEPSITDYSWSPADYLNNTTISNPTFAPKVSGQFTPIVTATNQFGCTASKDVTISVFDVRCGNNLDRVRVCHNNEQLCLSVNNVQTHLSHGCSLGSCNSAVVKSTIAASDASSNVTVPEEESFSLTVYPNPASNRTRVTVLNAEEGSFELKLYNANGALIKVLSKGRFPKDGKLIYEFQASRYAAGVYLLNLVTERASIVNRLVIQ